MWCCSPQNIIHECLKEKFVFLYDCQNRQSDVIEYKSRHFFLIHIKTSTFFMIANRKYSNFTQNLNH